MSCRKAATASTYADRANTHRRGDQWSPAGKPLSVVDASRQQGVAPTGGRGRARNEGISFCFGYQPSNFGCDNNMNFPALQNVLCLALSPTRSRGSPLPEGAFSYFVRTLRVTSYRRGSALLSLPCVRGGAARSAAEGLYLTKAIFFFCSANFTPLQSLRRSRASSLCTREPFWACANIAS